MDIVIDVRGVTLSIGGRRLLDDVDMVVPRGSLVVLVGPSGAGKSTLLRTLNRLRAVDSGEILLESESIWDMDPVELRHRVGMVFQVPVMFEGSVLDNLGYGPGLRGEPVIDPEGLMRRVGLDPSYLEREAGKLSIGERQRVSIARALANGPEVLLLDEPTSALDPDSTSAIESLLTGLRDETGLSMVMVSHDRGQAHRIGDSEVRLESGRVIGQTYGGCA